MVNDYINNLQRELSTGNALEHSYRPAFKNLVESISPTITAVNDPSRSEHGAPDFIFRNKDFVFGYAETKDVYVDLDAVEKGEQLKRYLGYSSLILTNYLEFRFFKNGEKYQTITIGELNDSRFKPLPENFLHLEQELKSFLEAQPESIRSAKRLAQIMGGKAARIRANVNIFLTTNNGDNQELLNIYDIMQKLLVHDLGVDKFADMYAQTLVYGLFVARYYDESADNFSRQEARDLVPASNPFLQHFFDHIVGPKFDKRLSYIVDELCEVFKVSDIKQIIHRHYNLFGETVDKDPIIHFYEDFLKEYDPLLRKQMGAYYTPIPVVQFMVNAVDDILKSEFNLNNGLTDTEKIEVKTTIQSHKGKKLIHRVQILDPAVGTATFLNQIILSIFSRFKNQEGAWQAYVQDELLPRLHGFELMMAPYTIAHLKLALTLKETGIQSFTKRLGVYLTNTLEEGVKDDYDLFSFGLAEAITEEARAANVIKKDTPIMIVIGNPPYSGVSSNMTKYANSLVDQYKVEPGGKEKLKERKHWLNDDYVKFLAFAENLIEKTGEGIVAMITNHGYLDNPTFRGMRWHLAKTFSSIYILDLHGNTKKNESSPDGGRDENVFDIQQGVAIMIAVKNKSRKNKLAKVFRSDIYGKRKTKFEILLKSNVNNTEWEEIALDSETYSFTKNQNQELKRKYEGGISVADLFLQKVTGIVTMGDGFVISKDKNDLKNRIEDFLNNEYSEAELKSKYGLGKNYAAWILQNKKKGLYLQEDHLRPIAYRPFDDRWIYFDSNFVWRTRSAVMNNFIEMDNTGLVVCRQAATSDWSLVGITNKIADDSFVSNRSKERAYICPLYLCSDRRQINLIDRTQKLNLNMELVGKLLSKIGKYTWEDSTNKKVSSDAVTPMDVLDYMYAILHSSVYRQLYKEFLRLDFPRIPIVNKKDEFWQLVNLGGKLRSLHLLKVESNSIITTYDIDGDNSVDSVNYLDGNIYINETQYFGNISSDVWNFSIGGYQPAQKWLKDRKGETLKYKDISHYQKIVSSMNESIHVVKLIDEIFKR